MTRSFLIASAIAAALAAPALAESNADPALDEKCYGVSARDVAICGSDAQSCAYQTSGNPSPSGDHGQTANRDGGQPWAYVPRGTCVKIYGGSLTPKSA